jgi:hypothetical protein
VSANVRHSSENGAFMSPVWLVEIGRYVLGGIDMDPASSEFANRVVKAPKIYTVDDNGLLAPKWEGRVFLNCPGGLIDAQGRSVHRSTKANPGGCTVTGSCGLPASPHADTSGMPLGHTHKGVTSSAVTWWRALCRQWERGHVTAAFFVGFSLELLQSCQGGPDPGHHPLDFYCCVPRERIKFDAVVDGQRVPGKQPTHSNVLVLLPFRDDVLNAQSRSRFEEALTPVGYIHRGNGMYS